MAFNPAQPRDARGRFVSTGVTRDHVVRITSAGKLAASGVTGEHTIRVKSSRVRKYAGHATVESYVAAHPKGRATALRTLAADHKAGRIGFEEPQTATAAKVAKVAEKTPKQTATGDVHSVAKLGVKAGDTVVTLGSSKKYGAGLTVGEHLANHPKGAKYAARQLTADYKAGRIIFHREGRSVTETTASRIERSTPKTQVTARQSPNGGPLHITPQIAGKSSPEFQSAMASAWRAIPERVRARLAAHGHTVHFAGAITDVRPDLSGVHPRGWPAGETWDNADGLYSSSGQIVVAETALERGPGSASRNMHPRRSEGVLNHETGHAFDHALGFASTSPEFMRAYEADAAEFHANAGSVSSFGYYLQSGEAGPSEMFAEQFAQLQGAGASYNDLIRTFPRSAAAVRNMVDSA